MGRKKFALIGAGNIGGQLAYMIAQRELGDVVLLDIPEKEGVAKGKALDIMQNGGVDGFDCRIVGTSKWEDCAGADLLIITAGIPRKPGQDREDLIGTNLPIIRNVAENAKEFTPNAMAIVVANPLDAMVYEFKKVTGWPRNRVMGMAGILDTCRFSFFLAEAAGVSVKDVRTMVLGGHGDQMVPLISYSTINGIPVTEFLGRDKIDAIVERTAKGGGEIVKLMGTSAWFAPAAAAIEMAEAVFGDSRRVLPCAAELDGEYGLRGLFMGVPCVLGAEGIEEVKELPLSDAEREMLQKSAGAVKGVVEICDRM
jgi:malate dehydrogenase